MLSPLSHRLSLNWTADHFPLCVFGACFLFGFGFVCSVALGVVFFFCCVFAMTAAGLCTGPIPVHFCGPQPDGGYMYALISQFTGSMQHATERVERPGESQEALGGKKHLFPAKGLPFQHWEVHFCGLAFSYVLKAKKRHLLCHIVLIQFPLGLFYGYSTSVSPMAMFNMLTGLVEGSVGF